MFRNRQEAGEKLAGVLKEYAGDNKAVILAIPRGGVEVGAVVAKILQLPLDIIITRKIGARENPEFAIAAVSKKTIEINRDYMADEKYVQKEVKAQRLEIARREKIYRGEKKALDLGDKKVIIIDDGLATGLTMEAAVKEIKTMGVKEVIVAIPVASEEAVAELKKTADRVISLEIPIVFWAVGQFYENFYQLSDEDVIKLLR